jgi:hypothetical protein
VRRCSETIKSTNARQRALWWSYKPLPHRGYDRRYDIPGSVLDVIEAVKRSMP